MVRACSAKKKGDVGGITPEVSSYQVFGGITFVGGRETGEKCWTGGTAHYLEGLETTPVF